jgi:hypothetical protein
MRVDTMRAGRAGTWRRAVAATILGALAALSFSASASAAKAPASFFGVVPQTFLTDADYTRMGTGKVGTLRIVINWATIDPTAAAGDSDWSTIDPIMLNAAQRGIEVQPFIFGTPAWVANGLDNQKCNGTKCVIFAPKTSAGIAAYATFVGEAVDRYGPSGTFWTANPYVPFDPIDAWQIWNEMNSKSFFAPKPSPSGYAKLLKASNTAIKSRDPSADVILGGMAELAGSKQAVSGSGYLADLYDVKGASKTFDAIAPHPYGGTVSKVSSQIDLFEDVVKKAHDKKVGMYVTEIGAGSDTGGSSLNKGKKGQATLLTDTYKYFLKQRKKLNIEAVDWFSWQDSKASICAWCSSSGLIDTGSKTKPSYKAFVKLTGGSAG